MGTVHVVGSINHDIVVASDAHPRPGETVRGSGLATFPGGKGANQAVAAARMGAVTKLWGAVGDDSAGSDLRAFLAEQGVDCDGVRVVGRVSTGTALITVAGSENTIVVVSGANGEVSNEDAEAITIAAGDVVVAQFETPVAATTRAFQRARDGGAMTVLNPAPMFAIPEGLLAVVDVLVVNETEFEAAYGHDPSTAADMWDAPNGLTVILTRGAAGVTIFTDGSVTQIAGVAVTAVDTTGAGDCFVGVLAAQLARGVAVADAAAFANRAAAISVTRHGAAPSMPTRSEIDGT